MNKTFLAAILCLITLNIAGCSAQLFEALKDSKPITITIAPATESPSPQTTISPTPIIQQVSPSPSPIEPIPTSISYESLDFGYSNTGMGLKLNLQFQPLLLDQNSKPINWKNFSFLYTVLKEDGQPIESKFFTNANFNAIKITSEYLSKSDDGQALFINLEARLRDDSGKEIYHLKSGRIPLNLRIQLPITSIKPSPSPLPLIPSTTPWDSWVPEPENSSGDEDPPKSIVPESVKIEIISDTYEKSYGSAYDLTLVLKPDFKDSKQSSLDWDDFFVIFSVYKDGGYFGSGSLSTSIEDGQTITVTGSVYPSDDGEKLTLSGFTAWCYDAEYTKVSDFKNETPRFSYTIRIPESSDSESNPTSNPTKNPSDPEPTSTPIIFPSTDYCCKRCTVGKPCGDTCISMSATCRKGPGCACWAN